MKPLKRERVERSKTAARSAHPYALGLLLIPAAVLTLLSALFFAHPLPVAAQPPATPLARTPEPARLPPVTPVSGTSNRIQSSVAISATNAQTLNAQHRWQAHFDIVSSLVFLDTPARLVSSAANGTVPLPSIRLWDLQAGIPQPIESAFKGIPMGGNSIRLQLSAEQRFLTDISGPYAEIWDAPTGVRVGSVLQLNATSMTMTGMTTAIIGGRDGLVAHWAIGFPPGEYPERGAPPEPFYWCLAESSLITGFNLGQPVAQVLYDPASGLSFILTESGDLYIYTRGSEGFFGSVNAVPRAALPETEAQAIGSGILAALQPGNSRIAYAGGPRDLLIYDFQATNPRQVGHYRVEQGIGCVAYTPDGRLLLVGENSDEGTLHILETAAYTPVADMSVGLPVHSCAISPDGALLATGHGDGSIVIWGAQ